MLKDHPAQTTIPAQDLERARRFYEDKLGFKPVSEDPAGLLYESGGARFLVFPSSGSASGRHTQMGWSVRDMAAEVEELKRRGITFEEYDLPEFKTENSVVRVGGLQAAWFRDSEGNLLGLVQYGEPDVASGSEQSRQGRRQ